jgi:hypothetical protein
MQDFESAQSLQAQLIGPDANRNTCQTIVLLNRTTEFVPAVPSTLPRVFPKMALVQQVRVEHFLELSSTCDSRHGGKKKMIRRKFAIWAGAGLLTVLAVAFTVQAAITSGLAGRWIFDDGSGITANDSSGLGNNGTLVGSAYFVTNDPDRGSVLNVNGVSGEVDFPYTPDLEPAVGTISVWVKPTVAQTADVVRVNTDLLVRCNMPGTF